MTTTVDEVAEQVTQILSSDLDPIYIVDYLYQQNALDEDEYEEISKTTQRGRRCSLMMNALKQRQNPIYHFNILVSSLEKTYGHLSDAVKKVLDSYSSCTWLEEDEDFITAEEDNAVFADSSTSSEAVDTATGFYDVVSKAGGGMLSNRSARFVFDKLSVMLNGGMVEEFDLKSKLLVCQTNLDPDVHCVVVYLQSCRHALKGNFEEGQLLLKEAELILKKTSSPVQYLVNILSVQCFICIRRNQFESLISYLTEAEHLLSAYPILCKGMSAGWILVDKTRYIQPLLTSRKSKGNKTRTEQALDHVDRALEQFQQESSRDGPFGYKYSLLLKASLLLACGEKMNTVKREISGQKIKQAAALLSQVPDIGNVMLLEAAYSITMTDLLFRSGHVKDALESANKALSLAQKLDFPEQKIQAHARVNVLQPLVAKLEERESIRMTRLNMISSSDTSVEQTGDSDDGTMSRGI